MGDRLDSGQPGWLKGDKMKLSGDDLWVEDEKERG